MKNPSTPKATVLAGVLLVLFGMAASAPLARADYTNNLLVGWTFNHGSLTSDLGALAGSVTFSEAGAGGNQTTAFDTTVGAVTIGSGRALVATAINSTAYPELLAGFTIWVRVTLNAVNSDVSIFGLVDATSPTATATHRSATFGLRSDGGTGSDGSRNVSFLGRTNQPAYISPGSGWSNVTAGNTYDLAIRVNDNGSTGSTFSDWVNGVTVSRTWDGQNYDLQAFQSFMIGRILQSGGLSMTIDEVRIYDAVLTNSQLSQITTITVPEPATWALFLGIASLTCASARRHRR